MRVGSAHDANETEDDDHDGDGATVAGGVAGTY